MGRCQLAVRFDHVLRNRLRNHSGQDAKSCRCPDEESPVVSVCSSEESEVKKTLMLRSPQNANITDQKVQKHTLSGINSSSPYWYAMCGSDTPCVPVVGTGKVTMVLSSEKYRGSSVVGITRAVPEPYWFSNESVSVLK